MKEFTTAAKAVIDEGDTFGHEITTKVDGYEVTFMPCTEGQMAMLLGTDGVPIHEKIATAINFFFGVLKDARDVDHFKQRLWDRSDPFGPGDVSEIVQELIEEWSGNPTQSSSDSTGSQPSTGASSTGSTPDGASTRSAFGPMHSAT